MDEREERLRSVLPSLMLKNNILILLFSLSASCYKKGSMLIYSAPFFTRLSMKMGRSIKNQLNCGNGFISYNTAFLNSFFFNIQLNLLK
jgi:hypothetical protein